MMKLTGFCIVLFAVLGLINDYSKRKRELDFSNHLRV